MSNLFSKETEYALRSLVYIQVQNDKGRRPGIEEITQEIEAPRFYTAKILQRLVKQGFLTSTKGKNGGFNFTPGSEELQLRIIVEAIEGTGRYQGCGFGLKNCDCENPCPLHKHYAPIREAINQLVTTETIQSLARKPH
jgi:Rrf2 family protein